MAAPLFLRESWRWAAYTFRQAYRSTFPWIALLVGIAIGLSGVFIHALALIEREAVFQSWCMSLWRVWSAVGVIIWTHSSYRQHGSVDRWRWCAAFESSYFIRALGQWGAGLLLHLSLLGFYTALGIAWSETPVVIWLQWTGYRSLEVVLMWSVAQWAYTSTASTQPLLAGGAAVLLYLVGRLAPALRYVIEGGLAVQPDAGILLKLGAWGIKGFLHSVPPFYVLDGMNPAALPAIAGVLAYAAAIGLYTLWRSASCSARPVTY